MMECLANLLVLLTSLAVILGVRVVYIIYKLNCKRCGYIQLGRRRKEPVKTMIIAGSGGHTSEILRLRSAMSETYSPREYVVANTDKMSEDKIWSAESERKSGESKSKFSIIKIPRSREVKQSYITSIATTLYSCLYSFPIVFKSMPDLILVNGPGTCIPLCAAGLILTVLGVKKVHIIYVESFCRVETLSLSGLLLYHVADEMLVQWSGLQKKYPKTRYIGRLV
ncbi:UDP-N-acetylglucosamine transferase subunit ALG14 homolog [Lineus longissimus]|uniref:UDP-N-acetylglucosamine transferase subunit ALG14 homolog n=1 Tax=Lineus longissimus TaxID=88925 RepID=UPI002B4C3694